MCESKTSRSHSCIKHNLENFTCFERHLRDSCKIERIARNEEKKLNRKSMMTPKRESKLRTTVVQKWSKKMIRHVARLSRNLRKQNRKSKLI